jgi:hypothetical protein
MLVKLTSTMKDTCVNEEITVLSKSFLIRQCNDYICDCESAVHDKGGHEVLVLPLGPLIVKHLKITLDNIEIRFVESLFDAGIQLGGCIDSYIYI